MAFLASIAVNTRHFLSNKHLKSATALDLTDFIGIGINLLNPKIILFNVTFLSQFITHGRTKIAYFRPFYIPISLPITISMVFMTHKFAQHLKQNPFYIRFLDWFMASILRVLFYVS